MPEGLEPALKAVTPSPPCKRAKASAIWLRLEFSTHTNKTLMGCAIDKTPYIVCPDIKCGGPALSSY
jgi:hypothetical protein